MNQQEQDRVALLALASIADSLYRLAHQYGLVSSDASDDYIKQLEDALLGEEEPEEDQ